MQSISKDIEKTTRTAQEITRSQQRAFEALTDNFLFAGRRNAKVARGFSEFLKLQESNARAAQNLFTSGLRFAELGQRNVSFAQEWIGYGVNFWRDQAESNVRTAEVVAQSISQQQESFRKLAEQWTGVYEDFFSSWDRYAKENLRRVEQLSEQVAERGLESAQQVTQQVAEQSVQAAEQVAEQATQVTEQGLQATEQSTRQGLRLAEETIEQAERGAKQADPDHLPIEGYDELNVSEVSTKLDGLTVAELRKVEAYEKRNKNRETVIGQIERKIKAAS